MNLMERLAVLMTAVVFAFVGCGGQVAPAGGMTGAALAVHDKSWTLTKVSLNESIGIDALQWTDGDLVVSYDSAESRARNLYRIQISGTEGKIVGTTVLDLVKKPRNVQSQFLILGNSVLAVIAFLWGFWLFCSAASACGGILQGGQTLGGTLAPY
jgi:hypothetical protein